MRNWPYAWALAQDASSAVKDKVGVEPLPKGDGEGAHPAATLGGWDLSVSKFSKHPAEAADLVMYLTSAAEQKRRAMTASLNPTIPSLYSDKDIAAANPVPRQHGRLFQGRGPAAVDGHRRQVQPGQQRVLQRGARRARQGEAGQ